MSKNELKHQDKYDHEEETVSGVGDDDELSYMSHTSEEAVDRFQKLDLNRMRRRVSLMRPDQQLPGRNSILQIIQNENNDAGDIIIPEDDECDFDNASTMTEKRSNMTTQRAEIRASIRKSLRLVKPEKLKRTKSDIDEVDQCLQRSRKDWKADLVRDYHRKEDGDLRPRKFKDDDDEKEAALHKTTSSDSAPKQRHKSIMIRSVAPPMAVSEQTKLNLGKVRVTSLLRVHLGMIDGAKHMFH